MPFPDDSDKKRLRRTCNDIVRETESARKWSAFPQEADGSTDANAVFWWDHETGELNKVAEAFEELSGDDVE